MFFFKKKPLKVFFQDHNRALAEVRRNFLEAKSIGEADRVVLWTDTTSETKAIIDYARSQRKKVIIVQHGRRGSARYFHPFYLPLTGDKHLVWGEKDKAALVEAGHDAKKIRVCGTPILKHFQFLEREKHEGVNIVFSPDHWDRELEENDKVAKILKKGARENDWNITTKIINGHDASLYTNPVFSDTDSEEHLDTVAKVLKTADLVVGISESTFELIAQYLDIPVVIMEEWYPKSFGGSEGYKEYRRVISDASKRATFDNLLETIQNQLDNPHELTAQRAQVCIDEGGMGLNAIVNICEEIRK